MRAARAAGVGDRHRVVEEDHDAVAGEALERAFVFEDQPAHRRVVFAQHAHHFLGLGGFGEGGEAAQVEEHHRDLAPVALQRIVGAAGDDRVGQLRREEALQPPHLASCSTPSATRCSSVAVPLRQFVALPVHLVVERLDAQQRVHAREQLGLVDRLGQEIVGAGLDALDALLRRVERGDQHDRQHAVRRVGADRRQTS